MTTIDRTAYPQFNKPLTEIELADCYHLSDDERDFVYHNARTQRGRLSLAVVLKTRQLAGRFLTIENTPEPIIQCVADQLNIPVRQWPKSRDYERTALRYRTLCREYLGSQVFTQSARQRITKLVNQSAYTMSDPSDLINVAIEALSKDKVELPAFSTLERLARHQRQVVHERLFQQVTTSLSLIQKNVLDALLSVKPNEAITGFAQLKQTPGPATLIHFRAWADRLTLLDTIIDPKPFLLGVSYTKIRQFAAEATAYSLSDMLGIHNAPKRYTLLLCLLFWAQTTTRDEVITMFLRRMKQVLHSAQEKLRCLQEQHREMEEQLIGLLGNILAYPSDVDTDAAFGQHVREVLAAQGGIAAISTQVNQVTAYHQNNYLPFLWAPHVTNRTVLFRLIDLLDIQASTQDSSLLDALGYISKHRKTRKPEIPAAIDLSFTTHRWQSFIRTKKKGTVVFDRRALEVCVFVHLAEALQSGDLYVKHSSAYADYRTQLLPWDNCQTRLIEYCNALSLPDSGLAFVNSLQTQLEQTAREVDASFPLNTELSIDNAGTPHLKRQAPATTSPAIQAFKKAVYAQMPKRHLLDILKDVQHWTEYHKHFGPASGSYPKLADPTSSYLFATFGFGCNLGASQTANHSPSTIDRHVLRRVNSQHTNADKLQAALEDIADEYARFDLPGFWGSGNVAIADGTQMELRQNNLLGEQHVRYGGYGGIAYHHISGEYIALFSHFIACGVWEAVYILDALLLNKSVYQPDTLHADTQGQSEPVFALAYLLGIKLFPRMRTWNDVILYRPSSKSKYEHIDGLFKKTVDWVLIQTHWQDMMQVVLSIQAGKVLPSMLLRKLNSRNRQNKLYRAFRELGRVIRTLFLLRYLSESEFRRSIRSETTKIESYNDFLDWISFGGQVIKSGDPVEQLKQVKYTDIVANAIMLRNVSDMTEILTAMADKGEKITAEKVATLSPYVREHLRRFGRYDVDMKAHPPVLNPQPVPISV